MTKACEEVDTASVRKTQIEQDVVIGLLRRQRDAGRHRGSGRDEMSTQASQSQRQRLECPGIVVNDENAQRRLP